MKGTTQDKANRLFEPTWPSVWFYGIVAVSLVLVAVTLFRVELREQTGIIRWVNLLNLTSENSAGTWWSGILLLMVGVHAFDGYMLIRRRQQRTAT